MMNMTSSFLMPTRNVAPFLATSGIYYLNFPDLFITKTF